MWKNSRSIRTREDRLQIGSRWVCRGEHLKQLAPLMDRVTALRTVNHNVIDEHAAATNFMHIGRPVSGGKLEAFLAENCGLTQQTTRAVQIYDATSFGDEPASL